jgi:regulatory protein
MEIKRIQLDYRSALIKAGKHCAYQERSQHEVRNKLYEWGVRGEDAENIIVELINQGYINEERFAIQLANGKFRIKHWGKVKITKALKLHHVSAYCIKKALQQIPDDDYIKSLKKVLQTKTKSISGKMTPLKMRKLMHFAQSKGYEIDLIRKVLKADED